MGTTAQPYLSLRETHSAGLVLVGDRVYKFKKPVNLGFLDFTSPETRTRTCRREVELNSRFAPDVYLGVADLALPDGRHESMVVMRRMPEDRRLSTLVTRGVDVRDDLRHLAHQLATAHERSPRGPEIDAEAALPMLRARWKASFQQVRPYFDTTLDPVLVHEVERLTLRFLAGRRPLFDHRVTTGCAVDGHGDLMADDVFCLDDGPRALDCLEFDDRLRYVDRLDDAAFLAMDLERLGAPELGAAFLGWYTELAGDPAPPSLVHHYVAYRAFVRAKVAAIRADQGSAEAVADARSLTRCTHRHLAASAVTLTLVGGTPGTGKTTVASGIADRLGMVVLSSDRIRKELVGIDPETSAAAPYGTGIYSPAHTARTYDELLDRARRLLGLGESVVLDASWLSPAHRDAAREVARTTHSDLHEIVCQAPAATAMQRLAARRSTAHVTSDADAAVATTMAEAQPPWPEAFVLDTSRPLPDSLDEAVGRLRPVRVTHPPRRRPAFAPD